MIVRLLAIVPRVDATGKVYLCAILGRMIRNVSAAMSFSFESPAMRQPERMCSRAQCVARDDEPVSC
jgi:hypothetical protein